MAGSVTFDFHNTLVRCDAWSDLEVRHLCSAFFRWDARGRGETVDPALQAEADQSYRRLREHVVRDGNEVTAEACVAHVAETLGQRADAGSIRSGVEALMRETLAEAEPIPGALTAVRELHARGVPIGVVSSAVYHPFLEWSLAAFGLRDAFADVTTSASAGFYKSRPEIYWHAAAALGASPGGSVHVGDSYRFDVLGARRAGFGTVWLRGDGNDPPDGEPPDLTLGSLEGAAAPILALLRSRSA